jgi:hypothetical protein
MLLPSLSGLMAGRSERKLRKCSVRVRGVFIGEIYAVLTGGGGQSCDNPLLSVIKKKEKWKSFKRK